MSAPLFAGWVLVFLGLCATSAPAQSVSQQDKKDFDNTPTSFGDVYRIVGGTMFEHWDVLETLVSREQSKNPNGKF